MAAWRNPYIDLVESQPGPLLQASGGALSADQRSLLLERAGGAQGLFLEIGSGSGMHLIEQARRAPRSFFVGFELRYKRAFNSARKAEREHLPNLAVVRGPGEQAFAVFHPGTVDGIFILFPDPWEKRRCRKNRVINPAFLEAAGAILKAGGFIRYKTDHDSYFDETAAMIASSGIFEVVKSSRDLHRGQYAQDNVPSEFERLFISKRAPILFLEASRRGGV